MKITDRLLHPVLLAAALLSSSARGQDVGTGAADIPRPGSIAEPRVLAFLPDLNEPLPLRLHLPRDFTVAPFLKSGGGLHQGVLWGTRGDLKRLSGEREKEFNEIKGCVFQVRLSTLRQIGPARFQREEQLLAALKKGGLVDLEMTRLKWGSYPVLAVSAKRPSGTHVMIAWVGLNHDAGWTLFIDARHPQRDGHPTVAERTVWDDFLTKTTELEEPVRSRVMGFDYHHGHTIVSRAQARIRVSALRQRPGAKLFLNVTPLTKGTTVSVGRTSVASFERTFVVDGRKIDSGTPCIAVHLSAKHTHRNSTTVTSERVIVIIREVAEVEPQGRCLGDTARLAIHGAHGVTLSGH